MMFWLGREFSMTPELNALLDECDIRVIPVSKVRGPMETYAENTMLRIMDEHGEGHLRSVLIVITETENNSKMLIAPVLWAVSDILLAHPSWFGSAFLDAMDGIDLSRLHAQAKANRRAVQPRQALATMLYGDLSKRLNAMEAA
jgi:GTP:adenosylcobinamide-phosphate guanylyltransferase